MTGLVRFHNWKFLIIVSTIINFSLWGCSDKKINSCNAIQQINSELNEVINNSFNSENIADIAPVADRFSQAQEKLSSNLITDETLSSYSQQLGDIYRQYSETTKQYLSAYKDKDREAIIKSRETLTQLFEQQTQTIEKINSYCLDN